MIFFFFKQKTAYEMRISDWSSDVCSSDLLRSHRKSGARARRRALTRRDQLVQERPLAATIARVEAGRAQGALLHACCSVKHTQRLLSGLPTAVCGIASMNSTIFGAWNEPLRAATIVISALASAR